MEQISMALRALFNGLDGDEILGAAGHLSGGGSDYGENTSW